MPLETFPTPLVSTTWLAEHLAQPWVRVIDASSYLPTAGRDARAEYEVAHIPGAQFCDLAWISDDTAPFPHTLPSAAVFAERIGSLGISNSDAVVVYDSSGHNFSAPRIWWMLRTFGHERVAVLDGGLVKWQREGRAVESGVRPAQPAVFAARLDASRVRDLASMRGNAEQPRAQVVDARSPGRFAATEPEPRAGVRGGHMPHSKNVHYAKLVSDDGTLRPAEELREIMRVSGVDLARPIIASCGTGVTACAVVLALDVMGVHDAAVYDGSWTEWGSQTDTPIETGPS
jgi:thiosulfate/3-mercaptopyruvate sulfurtransferase